MTNPTRYVNPPTRFVAPAMGMSANAFKTVVDIDLLGKQPYRVLVNVGEYLDQYDQASLPANVRISNWYPQVAVLPHVDVFIQHGGNNSFNESLYHGIPPLVMPFVWDGHDNAQRVNDTHHGIGMHRYQWRDEELLENIRILLTEEKLRENVRKTGEYMRSQDGKEKAA